jgi:hypothetical protein
MPRLLASKQRLSHQHYLLLLLLLLLLISGTTVVVANECEVGTDGSCLDREISNDDDNCVDANEKCKEWADSGKIPYLHHVTCLLPVLCFVGINNALDSLNAYCIHTYSFMRTQYTSLLRCTIQ